MWGRVAGTAVATGGGTREGRGALRRASGVAGKGVALTVWVGAKKGVAGVADTAKAWGCFSQNRHCEGRDQQECGREGRWRLGSHVAGTGDTRTSGAANGDVRRVFCWEGCCWDGWRRGIRG